ncbi:MAG: DUF2807 domain-containing protein [Alphaproteobacteria bacterium]|nr:MAG: DUF2807 domain-containing protein [Alphaproteobacteria bacterium]
MTRNSFMTAFMAAFATTFTTTFRKAAPAHAVRRLPACITAVLLGAAAMVAVAGTAAAGKGEQMTEETRSPGAFDRILLKGEANVDLRIGTPASLLVRAHRAGDLRRVETRVVDGRLIVETHLRKGISWRDHTVEVAIVVPRLKEAVVGGAGDLTLAGLDEKSFSLRIAGAGDATLEGRCGHLDMKVSGAGDVRAGSLVCRDIRLKLSGAGDVDIPAGEELEARISGAGDLQLFGPCGRLKLDVSGAGDVNGRQLRCRQADIRLSGVGDVSLGIDGPVKVHQTGVGDVTLFGDPQVREIEKSGVGSFRIHRAAPASR